jgi:hypothetical protein
MLMRYVYFILLLLVPARAFAQDQAASLLPLEVNRLADRTCFVYSDYIVVVNDDLAGMGDDIAVLRRASSTPACDDVAGDPLVFIHDPEEPDYFFGMWGPYLFIDSGTGPEDRGLQILNVETGTWSYRSDYWSDSAVVVSEVGTVTFFRSVYEDLDRSTCALPDSESFGIWFEEEVVLDLETGEVRPTGKVTCSYRM